MAELTHIDAEGRAHMVDVTDKPKTARISDCRTRHRSKQSRRYAVCICHSPFESSNHSKRKIKQLICHAAGIHQPPDQHKSRKAKQGE